MKISQKNTAPSPNSVERVITSSKDEKRKPLILKSRTFPRIPSPLLLIPHTPINLNPAHQAHITLGGFDSRSLKSVYHR